MEFFNAENRDYYRKKKQEILNNKEDNLAIKEDAKFIHHYGMSAYLELVPELRGMGIGWHNKVVEELQRIRYREKAEMLLGIQLAVLSGQDKKAGRKFNRLIKEMTYK